MAAETRLQSLDLVRGVAVLGILAVNIASFAAAPSASYSPDLPEPGSLTDRWAFLATLILFEGKMRALFSILFGASMVLFIERAEARGRNGTVLQLRRLGWLALFGLLHFLLIWQWDILFLYAVVGILALPMRQASPRALLAAALLIFSSWQVWNLDQWLPSLAEEAAVAHGTASPAVSADHAKAIASYREEDQAELASLRQSWPQLVATKIRDKAASPLIAVVFVSGETMTYILIGMALLKSGFFSGEWSRRRIMGMTIAGLLGGGAATIAFAAWAQARDFPEIAMRFGIGYGLSFAHLGMALGYAGAIVLAGPAIARSGLGQRLIAAGRMAFSNYIGTSLVMTALFYGWGLGLIGRYGAAVQWLFVVLGWALMLAWSKPWLSRHRQGPLEWIWRSLTEWRVLRTSVR